MTVKTGTDILNPGARGVVDKGRLTLDNTQLKVTIKQPVKKPPTDTIRLFVKGLSDKTTPDGLHSYMEVVSGVEVLSIEFEEQGCALVTFNETYDYQTITQKVAKKPLQGKKLSIEQVPFCNCVEVTGLNMENTTKDAVLYFFDNPKNGGGVTNVELNIKEGCALVHFVDLQVVTKVLSKSHSLNGAQLEVKTHNPFLGKPLSKPDEHEVFKGKHRKTMLTKTSEEMEQELANVHGQLREKKLKEANLHEQLREKTQQEENSQRKLSVMKQQVELQLREIYKNLQNSVKLSREREQQLTNIQGQLREKELQETNLHEQLREKDRREENSQRQLREMEQQLTILQGQFRDKEQETANLYNQVSMLEGQLSGKDQEVNELEITLSTAQQELSKRQHQQSPDWVISRDQIQLTDKVLGRGGWGSVVEGKFCGCAVAVKQVHELIISIHNRSLFEREMDIASRCRHPCLLQFIGATNDEQSPLFLTELMESSLRALLEQRPLSATEVSIISLDVARALCYLHQKKPYPIIHRDISSANVLLWRQGGQWRGKVSDYGAANFMQHTMTVAPGAMIYSAPEALTSNQTVKVDVYSFAVLLCEMCIQELPDPERRNQQVAMVTSRLHRALIRECLQSEPRTRPNMEEIIEGLKEPL